MNEIYEKYNALSKEHDDLLVRCEGLESKCDALREERDHLEKRLRHLLESDYIRSFDEYDPRSHNYALDIRNADNLHRLYEELGMMATRHRSELEMLKECVVRMTLERLGVS